MSDLHRAIRRGDKEEIHRLLASGATVDVREGLFGHTPLMEACISDAAGADVVKLLLDAGADCNAWTEPEDHSKRRPFLVAVMPWIRLEDARLLLAAGADINACSAQWETALTEAASNERFEIFDLLLAAGASLAGSGSEGEFVMAELSGCGEFTRLAKVLALGEDPAPLQWTPLCHAIVFGSQEDVVAQMEAGADLEHADHFRRTPFLLAVHAGKCEATGLLLEKGANRGARGRGGWMDDWTALDYAISRDDAQTLRWLLDLGFDPEEADASGNRPLKRAATCSAVACFRVLLEAGADWRSENQRRCTAVDEASDAEIVKMLVDRGADPGSLLHGSLVCYIGLAVSRSAEVTRQECLDGFFRRFGAANPERMKIPFWDVMVRGGWEPDVVESWFEDAPESGEGRQPWCFRRYGMALTALADGRFVQSGGVLREYYVDPDFCIYNDVIIHDGKGGFEILGYPEEVFPPTDYHSATLAGDSIYLIGNLGYPSQRGKETPVYRLYVETGVIEKVETSGESPGWISDHKAVLECGRIRISGGSVFLGGAAGSEDFQEHTETHWFDPATGAWERGSRED